MKKGIYFLFILFYFLLNLSVSFAENNVATDLKSTTTDVINATIDPLKTIFIGANSALVDIEELASDSLDEILNSISEIPDPAPVVISFQDKVNFMIDLIKSGDFQTIYYLALAKKDEIEKNIYKHLSDNKEFYICASTAVAILAISAFAYQCKKEN